MGAATSTAARFSGAAIWSLLRSDERGLLATAGLVFAIASAGAAMSGAAADAMFLSDIGTAHLGGAVAASNALLAIVLAVVGGLADRLERRRVLASLAGVSALAIAGLAVLSIAAPRVAAAVALVGGKQLAAATDLAFWVVIGERLDARRSRRMLPLLAAAGGLGAAIGAVLVIPIASAFGARGVLLCSAAVLAIAGGYATRLPATRRVAPPAARPGSLIARSWRDGARAVRRHPLARHLAIVVGAAGAFGSLAYFALGISVAAQGGSTADLAALLGGVRGSGQLLTLVVQLTVAPRLLPWLGTGHALLLAPLTALAAGTGLVIAPVLAMAVATQISARVLDAGIETPAERVAQTLLPGAVRGRIAGFLEGTAKRAGAVLGGLVAAVLVGAPEAFYAFTAIAAAVWLFGALRIARELPTLAIEHVVHDADPDAVVDDRAVAMLVRELDGPRPERAAEVLARLHRAEQVDATGPLTRAATTRGGEPLWRALITALATRDEPAAQHGPAIAAAITAADLHDRELASRDAPVESPHPKGTAAESEDRELVARDAAAALLGGAIAATGRADRELVVRDTSAVPRERAIARRVESAGGMERELAVRALGLAGGVEAAAVERWRASNDPGLALTAEIARLRLSGEVDAVIEAASDAIRDGGGAARVALEELTLEIARALAADSEPRAVEAARHLARALRRGRGDAASRASAFAALAEVVARVRDRRSAELSLVRADLLELARERVEAAASPPAPPHMLTSLLRTPGGADDAAPEIAAALRCYGHLLDGADAIDPDDLRRIARALGEPDDDIRAAAEDALVALGSVAAGELIATAAWGRRRARDRAAALLAELPVTPAAIVRLIDAELDALDRSHAAIAALTAPGDELLARRLDERLAEIAHTVLLLVAASRRSPAIARAAVAWRHARGGLERARTLAVIEAALPRARVGRLVEAVDDLTPADRAAALARAGATPPARDAAIRAELAGRDRLARALALHIIGAAGRSAHRDTIAEAARAEAIALPAGDLLRRLSQALDRAPQPDAQPDTHSDDGGADMPSRVESLIALGRVPLLASLTTRQLADVAERARWTHARSGSIVVTGGDLIDALIVVDDGELAYGERRIGKGDVVDELACVAPLAATADLRAVRASRLIRLERVDFEELVDDVPGLAAAVCRALGERARRAEDTAYRSPLASRM